MVPALFQRLFRAAERRPWTLGFALATPAWIAVVRMLLERELSMGPVPLGRPPMPWFAHIFVFYLALSVCLTALLSRLGRIPWRQAAGPVGMGLTLGTVPPLIDVAVYGIGHFAYEYQPSFSQFPWTLHFPPHVLPWGETVVLWTTVLLMGLAGVHARAGWGRVLGLAFGTWALIVLFLVGLPWASTVASQRVGLSPSEWRNALFGLATFIAAVVATGTGLRLAKRTLHVLLAPVLAVVGAAFRGNADGTLLLTCVHLGLMSAGFALANDFHDAKEDLAAGRGEGLDAASAQLLTVVPLIPVLHVLSFRLELGLSLLGFAVVSYAYHADPLRLKCVFPLSYKTEGFLGGLAFFAGLSAAQPAFLTPSQLWATLAVTLGTPAALVFKDWKDVDGDAAGGVNTAFVVLERQGWSRNAVRRLAAALLALSLGIAAVVGARLSASTWHAGLLLGGLAALAAGLVAFGRRPLRDVALTMGLAECQLAALAWFLWR